MTVVGSDIPSGQQVKWYAGGVVTTETLTIAAGDVTAKYKAITKKAEYGSVVVTRAGVVVSSVTEKIGSATADATEALGCEGIGFETGILVENDVVTVQYLDIETTPLVQIAACMDVKTSISTDTKEAAVHGQANKLKTIGAISQEAELEEFQYSQAFISTVLGDSITGTPATGMSKLTTKVSGVKKIGCLVGKRYGTGYTTVTYKWFLIGAQCTGVDKEFPTEDFYKDSMKFTVDEYLEVDLVA